MLNAQEVRGRVDGVGGRVDGGGWMGEGGWGYSQSQLEDQNQSPIKTKTH